MQVIRSIAAARRMPPFRAIVRGCGLRDRLNRNSLRPPQLMSVRRGSELKEWNKEDEDEDAGERSEQTGIRTTPIRADNFAKGGRAASERGLPVDRPVGMMGGPRAYTL